ncbi:MAG: nitrate ABC transporter [Candidatus Electrothrix sp. AR3]|nr:nitrate ABC transporter [Candidatus Electrothrix sp. AR3]
MRTLKISAVWLVILFLCLGCQQDSPELIRLGTNVWPGYEPFYLAREQGYYKEINLRLVEYSSASEVIRAFKNENLEAAALTLDEAIYLSQSHPDIMVVLVTDISNGGDVIISKENIENVNGLHGKRVAVESNALGAYFITRALETHQMNLEDISLVHLEVSAHEEAFLQGRVDAAVTFEPVKTKLIAAGGKEIFSSRQIPNEIVDVLVIHKRNDLLTKRRKTLQKIMTGWFKALDDLKNSPQESANIISKRLKITPEQALASYDGLILPTLGENRRLLSGGQGSLVGNIEKLSAVMLEHNLLKRKPEGSNLISEELLP